MNIPNILLESFKLTIIFLTFAYLYDILIVECSSYLLMMEKKPIIKRIVNFYWEGFKNMTIGKTLWLIILIKLFVMFVILKIFFFPNYLGRFDNREEKQNYVVNELIQRSNNP